MTPNLVAAISTVGAAAVASTVGWFTLAAVKRRLAAQADQAKAQAAQAITDAAVTLINPLQARISALETRVCQLEDENRRLRVWGQLNYGRVIEMGGNPYAFHEVD